MNAVAKEAFELWETDSGNLLGVYATADAALADVRLLIERHGTSAVETLCLAKADSRGKGRTVAAGAGLERLAVKNVKVPA